MFNPARPLGVAAAVLLALGASAHAQSSGTCLIQRVEGTAAVTPAGAAQRPAQPGLVLAASDSLRTQAAARVTLACENSLKVVVGPDTEITVEGLMFGEARSFSLRLLNGIIGLVFKGSGDGVQVRTPSAVAAVRSTEWAMRVNNTVTEVFTREGAVAVAPSGNAAAVRLGPGDGVDVAGTGEIKPVVRWRPPRIASFVQLLGPDW